MPRENTERQQNEAGAAKQPGDRASAKLADAKEALKKRLLAAVMLQAIEEIGSAETIADMAMSALDTNSSPIPAAAARVQELLVKEIVDQALASIAAVPLVDFHTKSLDEIREAVKNRILTQVLASAIREIHQEVVDALNESPLSLDITDAVFEIGSLRNDDAEEEDMSALDDLIASDEPVEENPDDHDGPLPEKQTGNDGEATDKVESLDNLWRPLSEFQPEESTDVGRHDAESKPEGVDSDEAYYVYGILAMAGPVLEEPLPLGVDGSGVEGVVFEGLSALVSRVRSSTFCGKALKRNMKDASWRQKQLRRHVSIIEEIRARQTLLPIAFCTVYPDLESVRRLLESGYDSHRAALEHVEGKQEWAFRIYRNRSMLEERVSESDRRAEDALRSMSNSVASHLRSEMDRTGDGDQNAIDLTTEHCRQRSHESVLSIAADFRVSRDRGKDDCNDDEDVVLDMAYLVEEQHNDEVIAEVERLQAEYADVGFRFELTGPGPPYQFVSRDNKPDSVVPTSSRGYRGISG